MTHQTAARQNLGSPLAPHVGIPRPATSSDRSVRTFLNAVPLVTAPPANCRHSDQVPEEMDPMRAYLTATGMAFGLVAVWAALVPLFA